MHRNIGLGVFWSFCSLEVMLQLYCIVLYLFIHLEERLHVFCLIPDLNFLWCLVCSGENVENKISKKKKEKEKE